MSLNSIHNGRGFFSDYWLGSLLASRKTEGPRLTPAQARKYLFRLSQLRQRVDTVEPLDLTSFREKYARPLLSEIFGFTILENGDDPRVRLLGKAENVKPLLAVVFVPDHDELDSRSVRSKGDKAMLDHDLNYGIVISPNIVRLVRRPGEGSKNAYLDFSVTNAAESEDEDSLGIAYRILAIDSFVPGPDGHAAIERLEQESRKHSERVSEDLKEAVFSSAELLIHGCLEDVRSKPDVFKNLPSLLDLRDTALLTLYRLLFILYAESRDERLHSHTLYLNAYSLERMVDCLMLTHRNEIPGNRSGLWQQLLVLFKIYDQGLPPLPGLQNIPPRGGTLFSDTTKEGILLSNIELPDSVVADLILGLATTRPRRGVGRERISFRELEIQQLGAVYEGLLEYEPRIAECTMIEAKVQGKEYVLAAAELCRLCEQKSLKVKGKFEIVEGTEASKLHPDDSDVQEADEVEENEAEDEADEENGEEDEDKGIKKGAPAKLIRRLEKDDFYFVPGSARKSSGSFYTREEIVHYLVHNALKDKVEGKTAAKIESLRIIDCACGSAHFLVGAARYLGKKLQDAYKRELAGDPPPEFYPDKELSGQVRDEWKTHAEAWCKRRIVEKCLFGVDLNPTAVQLAQVALWIESLAGDRPLSFFDHHIRCGNSLMGTWLDRLQKPVLFETEANKNQLELITHNIDEQIIKALDERILIDRPLPAGIRKDTPKEYEYKQDRLKNAESSLEHARLLFNLRNASAFIPEIRKQWWSLLRTPDLKNNVEKQPWCADFHEVCRKEKFFHWELEFPEIFRGDKKGFDCVLGNPPWEKVKPDRKEFYGQSDILIRAYTGGELDVRIKKLHQVNPALMSEFNVYSERMKTIAAYLKKGGDFNFCDWEIDGKSTGGDVDLFKFFVEQAHRILRIGARLGYLVPSAIYNNEGATGLRHLILDESSVKAFYGFENRKKIFNIHSSYKFVCLVLEKQKNAGSETEFPAAFMRHDIEELESGPPKGVQVIVKRSELEKLSPGTLAFLEYRSEKDREIVLKMYGLLPGMKPRPLLGDQGEGTWNAKFYREFDMTNDRDLWTKPDGKLWTPKEVCGLDWPADSSIPFNEVRSAMAAKGFWPLYEGKHIEQFLVDIIPVERWICLETHMQKYNRKPEQGPWIVARRIASNTNERTLILASLPDQSCSNDNCPKIKTSANYDLVVTVLNTMPADFVLRMRGVVSTLNYIHVLRMAIPQSKDLEIVKPIQTRSVAGQNISNAAEIETLWPSIWQTNHAVAKAYGLCAEDFEHILSTFPVFARKRPAFFAYLQNRVKEWKKEI